MIEKIVKKYHLHDRTAIQDDVAYWLSKTPEERIAAVEELRRQYYGNSIRFQRVALVSKRTSR